MNDMSDFPLPPLPRPPHDDAGDAAERAAMMHGILADQARALDGIFTRLLGQADENMTRWPRAAEAYARLAFQAQWNCRASLEAMTRADRLSGASKGDDQ